MEVWVEGGWHAGSCATADLKRGGLVVGLRVSFLTVLRSYRVEDIYIHTGVLF